MKVKLAIEEAVPTVGLRLVRHGSGKLTLQQWHWCWSEAETRRGEWRDVPITIPDLE